MPNSQFPTLMIDHLSLGVSDFSRSLAFYDAVLAELGFRRCFKAESPQGAKFASYGPDSKPVFWISSKDDFGSRPAPAAGSHIAFQAASRQAVDAFYAAALIAGGTDNGKPGLRPHYHPNYYAAFALDPDGHHIEAVCHSPAP